MRDVLLIMIVCAGSLVSLVRPVFGLLFFVFLGFVNPHSMTWGIAKTLPLSQVAGVCTILGFLSWSETKTFPRQRELLLLIALCVMFAISTVFAVRPEDALTKLILVTKILFIVILSTALINTKERVHALLRVIALSLGFFAAKGGFFAIVTGGNYLVYGPDQSFLAANNSIGLALAMNVPLLAYLSKIETRPWLRQVIRTMLILSYPAVICTYSRGAWIGLVIATMVIVLRGRHRFIMVAAAALLVVILLPFVSQLTPKRLVQRYDTLVNYEEDASAASRFWNWEFCRRVGMARPFTGGGFDFYSIDLYSRYYPEFLERWPGKTWSCHSMWFTVFGEHGFPGFFLWVALMISSLTSLRRIRAHVRGLPELSWMYECANAIQGALVAFMVVGTFLDSAYFDMYYFLVAIVIIIKEIARNSTPRSPVLEQVPVPAPMRRDRPLLARV